MTTEELAELFLVRLYDLAEAAPHPNFLFTVSDFAAMMGVTDRQELQRAIDLLGDRGFIIAASLDMWGGISAGITMEGSVFVENGGETGIIASYRENPQAYVRLDLPEPAPEPSVPPEPPQAGAGDKEARPVFAVSRAIEAIIADIEDILGRDASLDGETRKDALADLATLKIQMARNVKKRDVIEAVLADLCDVPSITPLVTGLRSIVLAYFG
ncbi:MAG: hypothetical protein ABSC19_10575 [Syntrophorhabdales bacterium]